MTTSRQAPEGPASEGGPTRVAVIPVPTDAPDRETLGRVLDALRELPQQSVPHRSGHPGDPVANPAVPLPRRRPGHGVPALD